MRNYINRKLYKQKTLLWAEKNIYFNATFGFFFKITIIANYR